MDKIFNFIIICSVIFSGFAYGKEVACIPRAEMGETTTGEHQYERDADLKISNLSRIDFDELTIISAEGNRSKIVRVEKNVYKTASSSAPYYFIANDTKSVVTELSVQENAIYIKVLLCK